MKKALLALLVLGALAAVLLWTGQGRRARQAGHDGPVVLISIDTLRADHLPAYGYSGVATPLARSALA